MPPEGRNVFKSWRRVYASMRLEEDADAPEEVEVDALSDAGTVVFRATRRGTRGGSAERVAVWRCWLDVLRHALSAFTRDSGSDI